MNGDHLLNQKKPWWRKIKLTNKNRVLIRVLLLIVYVPSNVLSLLVPRDPNLWIFGNVHGFKDNPKYLYEYLLQNKTKKIVWFQSPKTKQVCKKGTVVKSGSFKALFYSLRASVGVVGNGYGDLSRCTILGTKIINVWHGNTIKKIQLDDRASNDSNEFTRTTFRLWKLALSKIDLVVASSNDEQSKFATAFGLSPDKIPICGSPRYDTIYRSIQKPRNRTFHDIKQIKILIAPTWRQTSEEEELLNKQLLDFLELLDISRFFPIVKLHPFSGSLSSYSPKIKITTFDSIGLEDINESLGYFDILITDFSGIAFDYALLQRCILFLIPDLEKLIQANKFYHDPDKYFQTQIFKTGVQLANFLNQIPVSDILERKYDHKIDHSMFDGSACHRIEKLLEI